MAPADRVFTAAEADTLLRAGAFVPLDSGVAAEPVSARVYRHPALGDRQVIRLVPDPIGEADDLALQTLDFALAEVRGPLALGRPRGLGFPASAILADPANARYALDVVKEMERFARMAKAKPGNAKDGFDTIAVRLARTVPHFLPSFYEQAGRAFLEAGATAQAAAQFGKAREAERTYALPVDETQRRQSFLEFALAGALTAKALSEYAHELIRAQEPAQAHAAFKELCIQRTLGGLPPWTGTAAELRRTAKAAGLDVATEEADVLRQLLDAPATTKASAGFWSAYRSALLRLAKGEPAVRGTLLNLHPSPSEGSQDFVEWWIGLLRESGSLEALIRPDGAPPETLPLGGAGAWLERTAKQSGTGYYWRSRSAPMTGLLELVAEIAPAIRMAGQPVQLFVGYGADIDLLDAALAAGIDVAEPEPTGHPYPLRLDLRSYAMRSERRSLAALGAAPRFAAMLNESISTDILQQADKLAELPGLHDALRRWLRLQADRVTAGTLVTLLDAVSELEVGGTAAVRALDPVATTEIAKADVASVLARTLRGGLFTEVAWPALERANVDMKVARVTGFAWPALLVADSRRVVAVEAGKTVLEHDLRIPAKTQEWGRSRMTSANGQVFVGWRTREDQGYWSGRPGDTFEPKGSLEPSYGGVDATAATSVVLGDGARFEGGSPVHAGDTTAAAVRKVVSDGITTWVLTEGGTALREVDPATGRTTRTSLPRFFEEFAVEGWALDLGASWLMPLPEGADATVIGTANGLIGFRVRRRAFDGRTEWEIEGVDGRRFRGFLDDGRRGQGVLIPTGLLTLPGDAKPRPVAAYLGGAGIVVWDVEGKFPVISAAQGNPKSLGRGMQFMPQPVAQMSRLLEGTVFVPPPLYWFALTPRQPAASIALRSVTDAGARRLLDAVLRDLPDKGDVGDYPAVPTMERALTDLLPALTDERLRAGVIGAVVLAGRSARKLSRLEEAKAVAAPAALPTHAQLVATLAAAAPTRVVDDGAFRSAFDGLVSGSRSWYPPGGDGGRPLEQLAVVAAVMDLPPAVRAGIKSLFKARTPLPPVTLPDASSAWFIPLGRLGAIALRASLATTPEADRATLVAYLEAMATHGYPSRSGNIRILTVQGSSGAQLVWNGDRTLFRGSSDRWMGGRAQALGFEYAKSGRFELEKGLTLVSEERPGRGWGDERAIEVALSTLSRRGPVAWDPTAVGVLQDRTGLSRAAASLLLATLPSIDSYEHNFLAPETRAILDIKVAEAKAARDQLKSLSESQRLAILDAAMPPDPADLWEKGLVPVAERIGGAWIGLKGRRVAIDDDLLAGAARQLGFQGSPADPLRLIADPEDLRLTTEPPTLVTADWAQLQDAESFSDSVLRTVAIALPWVHATLPVGHPLLAGLPDILATVRQRLASPTLVLPMGWSQWPGHEEALSAMGARPWTAPRGVKVQGTPLEIGAIVAVGTAPDYLRLYLRPALIDTSFPVGIVPILSPYALAVVQSAVFLAGPGAEAIARRAASSPLQPGSWEADPSQSAPEVVDAVARELDVAADSARLFLQLLSLPAPTKAQLTKWNGWTAAAWTRAAKPLIDAGVIVQGQRARAGRDLFLSGPWTELPAPDLPVETWKLPLFDAAVASDGSVRKPLDRLVPLLPLHELFAAAWQRWRTADRPGFEQVPGRRG